ncbi:MAG: polysaccharide biosynthesis tyrosine autokinase [Candidatus Omnitrophica bacterium]|nr:polysaccharide biosynthesis tyrosine autokinase [Candidatus Omnitrophota bacterium]
MPETNSESSDVIEINLQEILNKLFKHRQTVISTVVICVVMALIYSFTSKPVYKSTSRILVEGKPPKIVKVEDVVLPDYTDTTNFFNSQIEILKSHKLAGMVFEDLGDYEPWGRRGKPADKLKAISQEERLEDLLRHVKISPVRMTQVIEVDVEDQDPQLAARIANSWVRAYMLFSSVDQLVQHRSELEADMTQQLKYLKEKHPVILGLKNEIEAINEKINNERARLSQADSPMQSVVSANNKDITNVKILDQGQVPLKPVRPRKTLNLLLGLIFGFFTGGALVFLFESLDQTVKSSVEIEQKLKIFCPVAIPVFQYEERHPDITTAYFAERSGNVLAAEAFRSLRTGIIFSNPDLPKKTFVVTSSSPSEGKTTVAVNLAAVFVQGDERTILVDADLRNPRLHEVFQVERAHGVTDFLALGKGDLQSFIRKTSIPGLDLLTCGEIPPNPSELLGSKKMEEFIAKLASMYDRVIFDAPPILAATDAVVLSAKVDSTILVVKAGFTQCQAALRSIHSLKAVNARLLGAVLNMVNPNDRSSAYYCYYYPYSQKDSAKKTKDLTKRRSIIDKLSAGSRKS